MTIHGVRANLARPPPGFAGRLPGGAVQDVQSVELVGGEVARLGRRGLPIAAGPADAGNRSEIRDVLAVVDLVEGAVVVVRDVHSDEIERMSAHGVPPDALA